MTVDHADRLLAAQLLNLTLSLHVFFFSSRRRHTSCGRDWSSDVCSSDLLGLPQESRPAHQGHGQEQLGLSKAAQLPSRHRIRHLVFEARLWLGVLRLARARPFQSLRLVLSRRLQPCPLCPAQADLTLTFRQAARHSADPDPGSNSHASFPVFAVGPTPVIARLTKMARR